MSDEPTSARRGKIGRLPHRIREELNRRLQDNQSGVVILGWLNSLPEVIASLEAEKSEPISLQNLSAWRDGGFADWMKRQERIEQTKILSRFAFDLAQAGGGQVSDGAAAILGGQILEAVEKLTEDPLGEQKLLEFAGAVSKLRAAEALTLRARVAQKTSEQRERALDLDERKFQRSSAKLFIKWAASEEARKILGSGESETVQMDRLVELFFGAPPTDSLPGGVDLDPTSAAVSLR